MILVPARLIIGCILFALAWLFAYVGLGHGPNNWDEAFLAMVLASPVGLLTLVSCWKRKAPMDEDALGLTASELHR